MIGLKFKNSIWERALLELWKNQAEIWEKGKAYTIVLTDIPEKKTSNCLSNDIPFWVGIGQKNMKYHIDIPLQLKVLESYLAGLLPCYENKTFKWNALTRQLINKQNSETIQLTEKEAQIVDFLILSPHKTASKTQLLRNVWGYTIETETHTLETTLYSLNKKLGKEKFIIASKSSYQLIE